MAATRRRKVPYKGIPASWKMTSVFKSDGRVGITTGSAPPFEPSYLHGSQVTVSENHPSWRRNKAHSGDVGGPFSTTRTYATLTGGDANFTCSADLGTFIRTTKYSGCLMPVNFALTFPTTTISSDLALNGWGTKAIAGCKPTNIFVDLSASLAELAREGRPKMDVSRWKSVVDGARKTAGNYLSSEFGWKPVISDISNVMIARERARAAIRQYVRDSGRTVRRQYDFGVQESTQITTVATDVLPSARVSTAEMTEHFTPRGNVIRERKTLVHRWFSGAFTYHLPLDDSLRGFLSESDLQDEGLVNFDLTPETLWNVAPWSWAVDWIVPVGDYISNLQDWSKDGLVMRYGYVMEHVKVSDTYTHVGGKNSNEAGVLVLTSESKKRVRANPFGFGLTWDGLSPRQLAIVTALGISRS